MVGVFLSERFRSIRRRKMMQPFLTMFCNLEFLKHSSSAIENEL